MTFYRHMALPGKMGATALTSTVAIHNSHLPLDTGRGDLSNSSLRRDTKR
jgi:hypothetical protein